jgi:predicted site-specific integrase-resolvase
MTKIYQTFIDKIPSFTFDEVKIGLVEATKGFKQLLEIVEENSKGIVRSPEATELTREQIQAFNELFDAFNARLDELRAEATKS